MQFTDLKADGNENLLNPELVHEGFNHPVGLNHAHPLYTPVGFPAMVKFYDSATGAPFYKIGWPDACFQSISGISFEFESETIQDGANSRYTQKLPKRPIYPNLALKRGFLEESEIFNWLNETLTKKRSQVQTP